MGSNDYSATPFPTIVMSGGDDDDNDDDDDPHQRDLWYTPVVSQTPKSMKGGEEMIVMISIAFE